MAVLERGGNAFDAACAAGFVLQVVEPHLNGPGGDLPAVFWPAEAGKPLVLCAQGVSPAAATIEAFRSRGHVLVPGTGVEAACVPGSFGGWLLLLEQFGTWTLDEVLAYAIGYAEDGYPVVPGITATIERAEPLLRDWPGSAELYLPAPKPGSTFRNPQLAATWRRLLDESDGTVERRAARLLRGLRRRGDRPLLARAGRVPHRARPGELARDARAAGDGRLPRADGLQDRRVGAGAGRAAAARLLEGFDVAALSEAELVHVMTEAAKLAFADRDANYGDADVQLHHLLSRGVRRRAPGADRRERERRARPGLGRLAALRT